MYDYKKVKCLGDGAYGSAILCRDIPNQRNVVVKEIQLNGLDSREREEAKKESEILRRLLHPNIIQYLDSGVSSRVLWIAMEHASEGDLFDYIQTRKRGQYLPLQEALGMFSQLCLAMAYLHKRRILHRDLKSKNIFLGTRVPRGEHAVHIVKLGDFGIAKVLTCTMALAKTQIGTPYYLSPEICRDESYGQKSDVWSMGCLLYEMTALEVPFNARNLARLTLAILKDPVPVLPLQHRNNTALVNLIHSLLQKDPALRPLVDDLVAMDMLASELSFWQQDGEGGVIASAGRKIAGTTRVIEDNTEVVEENPNQPQVQAQAQAPVKEKQQRVKRRRLPKVPTTSSVKSTAAAMKSMAEHRGHKNKSPERRLLEAKLSSQSPPNNIHSHPHQQQQQHQQHHHQHHPHHLHHMPVRPQIVPPGRALSTPTSSTYQPARADLQVFIAQRPKNPQRSFTSNEAPLPQRPNAGVSNHQSPPLAPPDPARNAYMLARAEAQRNRDAYERDLDPSQPPIRQSRVTTRTTSTPQSQYAESTTDAMTPAERVLTKKRMRTEAERLRRLHELEDARRLALVERMGLDGGGGGGSGGGSGRATPISTSVSVSPDRDPLRVVHPPPPPPTTTTTHDDPTARDAYRGGVDQPGVIQYHHPPPSHLGNNNLIQYHHPPPPHLNNNSDNNYSNNNNNNNNDDNNNNYYYYNNDNNYNYNRHGSSHGNSNSNNINNNNHSNNNNNSNSNNSNSNNSHSNSNSNNNNNYINYNNNNTNNNSNNNNSHPDRYSTPEPTTLQQQMQNENLTPAERMRMRKAHRVEQELQAKAHALEIARLQHMADKINLHEKMNDSQEFQHNQKHPQQHHHQPQQQLHQRHKPQTPVLGVTQVLRK